MKFESVLFGAAFIALALLSWPDQNEAAADRGFEPTPFGLSPAADTADITIRDIDAAIAA